MSTLQKSLRVDRWVIDNADALLIIQTQFNDFNRVDSFDIFDRCNEIKVKENIRDS